MIVSIEKKRLVRLLISLILSMVFFIVYLNFISNNFFKSSYFYEIMLFGWIGILVIIFILYEEYKYTNKIFTPYTIFVGFYFLFNYSQPILWSMGIHHPNEIGSKELFPGLSIPTDADILKSMLIVLSSILMLDFGANLVKSFKMKNKLMVVNKTTERVEEDYSNKYKALYKASLYIGFFSIPLTLIYSIQDLMISLRYGYKALYTSDFSNVGGLVESAIIYMFFFSIVGILVGSRFRKKESIIVGTILFLYLTIVFITGHRSSWVFKAIILLWVYSEFKKALNPKSVVRIIIFSILVLILSNAITQVRDYGLSIDSILGTLKLNQSPIISLLFEMGGSMGTIIVLQKYGNSFWTFGNTYLYAILGMVTNRIFSVMNIDFVLLSDYFSSNYLNISWGAGFSIVSEAILNFGNILAPLFMIIIGMVIAKILTTKINSNNLKDPISYTFVAAALDVLVMINRNVVHIPLKTFFYGAFVPFLITKYVYRLKYRKKEKI